jgi:hypothetical protein
MYEEISWDTRVEICSWVEWVCSDRIGTVDVHPISRCTTDTPERPLSVAFLSDIPSEEIPEGVFTFDLKLEMSAERKNVSLRGTESRTPARMTKNNSTTAPMSTSSLEDKPACNMKGTQTNGLTAILWDDSGIWSWFYSDRFSNVI